VSLVRDKPKVRRKKNCPKKRKDAALAPRRRPSSGRGKALPLGHTALLAVAFSCVPGYFYPGGPATSQRQLRKADSANQVPELGNDYCRCEPNYLIDDFN
jgi:hypothetical protein